VKTGKNGRETVKSRKNGRENVKTRKNGREAVIPHPPWGGLCY